VTDGRPAPVAPAASTIPAAARPAPAIPGRTGILGGTFDPIHLGHLAVAEEVREALGLEAVLFLPAGIPPHKPGRRIAPAADRVAMVEAAIAGNPAFRLSRVEVDRPGPSFAVDTLDVLAGPARAEGREPDLWWIMSAEAFAEIRTWREPERFIASCRVALVPRPGAPRPTPAWAEGLVAGAGDRVVVVDGPELGVSSSLIRARAAAGRSIRYLVPDPVAAHIDAHHLYLDPTGRTDRP
jgi:nicotinate-nucleotide adenylyltransferase